MKKFQFKLQKLLDYRETCEDMLLNELGIAQTNYERESVKLSEIVSTRGVCRDKLKQELSTGNADNIVDCYQYMSYIMCEESLQKNKVEKAEERKEMKTLEVINASKERKVLENLKEQKNSEYKREIDSHEQKFLDDLASFRRAGVSLNVVSDWGRE